MRKEITVFICSITAVFLMNTGASADNIGFIKSIFPDQKTWEATFPVAFTEAACNGKEILSREHFLSAAAKYPGFLGSSSPEDNVRELAAFLANVSQETTGAKVGEYNGGICFAIETEAGRGNNYCFGLSGGWDKSPLCDFGYYGRGALQITNPYNYHEASQEIFGDDRLVENPDLLLEGDMAWEASILFWMKHSGGLENSGTSVQGTTTCHSAITKGDDFGKTVEVINGNLECSNPGEDFRLRTKGRIEYFKQYVPLFAGRLGIKVDTTDHLDCFSGTVTPTVRNFRCGTDWSDANGKCGTSCNNDGDCSGGEKCFNGVDPKVCE